MPAKPKQLTIGTFRVRQLAVENNVRGQAMRRVTLAAVEGEALQIAPPKGVTAPGPEAVLSALLNQESAKFLELGDDYDLVLVRRG